MIISNQQLGSMQGGIEDQFLNRLAQFANSNLAEFINPDPKRLFESLKQLVNLGKQYGITTELNLVRFMVICFEKNLTEPYPAQVLEILEHEKWDQNKKVEELYFLLYSGIVGLKELFVKI